MTNDELQTIIDKCERNGWTTWPFEVADVKRLLEAQRQLVVADETVREVTGYSLEEILAK